MNWGRKLIPWLLAALYLALSMRGAAQGPTAPDGGQHATNGALIYDYLRSGQGGSPVQFAQNYLIHYPAISIGYHPPLFHVVEAGFFAALGVSPVIARLTVAVFAALSIVALFTLVQRTHGSAGFATLVVLVFASLKLSQQAASDVMLEFPSLLFVLLALHCLVDFQKGFTWRAAILYAVISAAAIWTKQHAVFLGLIPFFLVFTTGRWCELKRLPLWAGAMLFGAACLMLAAFMGSVVGDDYKPGSQVADAGWARFVLFRNIHYYGWRLRFYFSWPALVATLVACIACLVLRCRRRGEVERLALYAAWAAAVLPVPLLAWQHDERYLFAGFPAFIVILLDMLGRGTAWALNQSAARWAMVIGAVLLFGIHVRDHLTHNSGPLQAAEYVWEQQPNRVLVCGRGEYQFIFTIRCLAGDRPSLIILRGSKVPPDALQRDTFDGFAHDYGLEYVVIGDDWNSYRRRHPQEGSAYAWNAIMRQPTEHMELEQKFAMDNTFEFMEGDMLVYRFTNPSPEPLKEMGLWMNIMKENLRVELDRPSATPNQ
jgi:4-amino-4-deoxy-L-arabinose transferase-like glycosyltransferase